MNSKLVFQNPFWFVLICLAVGIAYAWLLYSKKTTLSKNVNWALSAGRALIVSLICFLLLNPLLRSNATRTLKPILVLGIDDSGSMKDLGTEALETLKQNLSNLYDALSDSNYDTEVRLLSSSEPVIAFDSLNFNAKKTDFGSFFRSINEEFSGQNLKKVVLVSDGIANAGLSPLSRPFPFQVDALGLGDSTVKRDLAIKGLKANKLAYLGNSFPIEVDIQANLYSGRSTTLLIRKDQEILERKIVAFNSDDDFKTISFKINASDIGKQRYSLQLLPLEGESNTRNNYRDVIIDVVDGKEKVLLVGLSPHPDIKAFKAIIEKNPLFELTVALTQTATPAEILSKEFDILILHQMPDTKGLSNEIATRLLSKMKPTFFILGAQSDLSRFNGMQEVVGISGQSGKTDKVTALFNNSFGRFISEEAKREVISKLPPVITPFGEYRTFPGVDIILYQKVGSVLTDRPLLMVNTNVNRKAAVLAAEGIWQWRMEEYFMNENHEAVDDYILKTLQLISVKEDKAKLRVYSSQNEVDIDESAVFVTEAYDDLYEKIYDVAVNLNIKGPGYSKSFNYQVTEANSTFELSDLEPGVYNFEANAVILGKTNSSKGQFVVKDKDLEFINTTADFDFLRTLASKNGGKFFNADQIGDLSAALISEKAPAKLINTEDIQEIINLKWLLPLLLLLASLEWGFRKYFGTY
ncbi:VWA domain-containing protein [uncultured Arcticibacterium sp.]|uniref:VWA domain-containing protein n=1 Tax=uncultured Arcticibacterium sp. TaxID=2173042 RepID=UPI0030F73451